MRPLQPAAQPSRGGDEGPQILPERDAQGQVHELRLPAQGKRHDEVLFRPEGGGVAEGDDALFCVLVGGDCARVCVWVGGWSFLS